MNLAIHGSFAAPKLQELVVARGSTLELLRPDDTTGKLQSIVVAQTFSAIRSMKPFRLHGASRDYVVVGSDSGKLTILGIDAAKARFEVVKSETFGKTGCRRVVPGQHLAVDPKGRAIMCAAVEKQKLVYIMNRDASNRLTVSSPLEAHRSGTVLFSCVGVDVHFDNPVFACLELEYTEADQDPSGEAAAEAEKHLTYYEVDLGLNHVIRRWSDAVSRTASMLLAVPGGADGPSGVLVVGENWVAFKHEGHAEVRAALPRREGFPSAKGLLVTAAATHRQRDLFFFLLQTEVGDLYKVTFDYEGDTVNDLVVSVFDTVACANALCITRNGLLFAAAEFGDHALFQFSGIGDDAEAVVSRKCEDPELDDDGASAATVAPTFAPIQGTLRNLRAVDVLESAAPITDSLVVDLCGEGTPQVLACCGRGARSSLRILRHGVKVGEMAVSELPGYPSAVWTLKGRGDAAVDRYIVVSFTNATLVLSIGETVEEVTDSGLLARAPTLTVQLLADDSILQVHPGGVRHVRQGGRSAEWKPPGKRTIEKASANARQVAISLGGGELVYFELDAAGTLVEMGQKDLGVDVNCLDVGSLSTGRARSLFLAVGGYDSSVRILGLAPGEGRLVELASMQVSAIAESLAFAEMAMEVGATTAAPSAGSASTVVSDGGGECPGGEAAATRIFLNVGLQSGVLQRAAVDATSGALSDTRLRFLGSRPVKLFRVAQAGVGDQAVLALSSRSWLVYALQGHYFTTPLSYDALDHACGFSSEQCPEGLVAISGNTLRVLTVDRLGELFNATSVPLRYTPRRMAVVPGSGQLLIIESDHNEYSEAERTASAAGILPPKRGGGGEEATAIDWTDGSMEANFVDGGASTNHPEAALPPPSLPLPPKPEEGAGENETDDDTSLLQGLRGPVPPAAGKWASCIRLVDAKAEETLELLELDNGEAAVSLGTCVFHSRGGEAFVVVGTARDLQLHPRAHKGCYLRVYRLLDQRLQLLHKTDLEDVPQAVCEYQGRLLVGLGKTLRIYDLGKRKLLRKAENKGFPTAITSIKTNGDRIFVGDLMESIFFVKYRRAENALVIFADDETPRLTTALCRLDHDTVCGADKFGNVFVLRLSAHVSDDMDNPTGSRLLWDSGVLNGASRKLDLMCQYHVGELVTSLHRTALVPGGAEAVVYVTAMGSIGALLPSQSREDKDFFTHLEMHMRQVSFCFHSCVL